MEFYEKLQELRKSKGLTQEELAKELYVSRTAISKWESGRGYPSIDSLKQIADYFSVTIDDLLSGDEILVIAEEDQKQKEMQSRDLVFGLLDCSCAMFFFLPFFGQRVDGIVHEVSLLSLTGISSYMRVAYFVVIAVMVASGLLTFALQNCQWAFWIRNKSKVSILLNAVGALLFILSLQPYAAAMLFIFLMIKLLMLVYRR
jgi:transcriptional regulator with XRE-family HTH domain